MILYSVTTILGKYSDFSMIPPDVLEAAAARGLKSMTTVPSTRSVSGPLLSLPTSRATASASVDGSTSTSPKSSWSSRI